MSDFCVFILTHGRPHDIKTLQSLEKCGYTGKIYIVIDNEDDTADEYKRIYGDIVIQFDKIEMAKKVDSMDNFGNRTAILYARHACFDIAKSVGVKYFVQLDDDYTDFMYRYVSGKKLCGRRCRSLDKIFSDMCEFLATSGAMTVALSQGGDFIGGADGLFNKGLKRKAMNSFFCKTDTPIDFRGTMNEDVTAYTTLGSRGKLFFTVTSVMLSQDATQKNAGGMTELYRDTGTYVKSFYSIISQPSSVKIATIGTGHKRIHHSISWRNTVPKILSAVYKK